jgi:hypothetical protein
MKKLPEGTHYYKVFHCYGCQTCWEMTDDDKVIQHPHQLSQEDVTVEIVLMTNALTNLLKQVNRFCEEEGEWDFETGEAEQALLKWNAK